MSIPQTLTNQGVRDSLLGLVYELGDCLSAIGTYLLVLDGPTDDIDLDELAIDIRNDATDALLLVNQLVPTLAAIVDGPAYIPRPDTR